MKRSTEPLPGHVHPSAIAYRAGCGCPKCVGKVKALRIQRERCGSSLVPAGPVRAVLLPLLGEGFSYEQISAATKVTSSVIKSMCNEEQQRIQRASADALASVTRALLLNTAMPTSSVPSVGSYRRLHALQRIGWTLLDLTGTDREYWRLQRLLAEQRPTIEAINHRWIARMYDDYWDTPGSSRRVRLRAERRGWPPPLAWDDDTIDDPAAQPNTTGSTVQHQPAADYQDLYDQGLSDGKIGAIKGVTDNAVRYWRQVHGLPANNNTRGLTPLGDEGDGRYRMWQQGHTDKQIADRVGRHPDMIRRWRVKHGLNARGRRTVGRRVA